jgi:small subunit ribosomal protein S9
MSESRYYATGKRKRAVARCWLSPGEGKITVNKRSIEDYFTRETDSNLVRQPLALTETLGQFDIMATVAGGGIAGQAGAMRHGVARALMEFNPEFRQLLKRAGFITRDARKKERKKYGKKGARASFQFSKR